MSLLATSYRYENVERKAGLVRALSAQKARVQNDERLAVQQKQSQRDMQTNLMSKWSENLEHKVATKQGVLENQLFNRELTCVRQAVLKTRQTALKKQMAEEHDKYRKELQSMGKAFYIKLT